MLFTQVLCWAPRAALHAALQISLLGFFLLDLFFQDFDICRLCQCLQLHNHRALPGSLKERPRILFIFSSSLWQEMLQFSCFPWELDVTGVGWSWLTHFGPKPVMVESQSSLGCGLKGHQFQALLEQDRTPSTELMGGASIQTPSEN